MSFFTELKRRNVIKVAAAYLIIAWLLMQVGDTLAPALLLPEWINSALAFFLILGFPLALFFAWAFELTPEGIRKETDVDRSESITGVTGQKLNYGIIALMALALGYFAFDKFVLDPGRDAAEIEQALQVAGEEPAEAGESGPPELSVAVLPFVNMSADQDNEYFSDGLTEELLNILAKIRELQVAGRTSSFAFKGKDDDLRVIGEKLNVKSILEGSVRKDDQRNRVRITAQLINADDGYHLWSETYDRELDDIFAIQEEIAAKVAQALRITLLGEEEELTLVADTDFSAYDLYLKALQGINAGGYVQLDEAVDHLQQALAIDPAYLPARLALVVTWAEMAQTGAISYAEVQSRGLPMLEDILRDHPDSSNAHVTLARLKYMEGDDVAAENEFIKALELDPRSASALQEYGRFLHNNGQVERGLELIDEALKIEPYAVRILWDKCQTSAHLQRFEDSMGACARVREIMPDSPLGYYGWALAHVYTGDIVQALKGYSDALERDPADYEMLAAMAIFWTWLGDAEQARIWLERADAIGAGQPVPVNARMLMYQFLEQHDMAKDLARQALEQNIEDRHGVHTFFRHALAFTSVLDGDYEAGLAPYRETYPWVFADELQPPEDYAFVVDDLLLIADLLKRSNPISSRAEELINISEEKIHEYQPFLGPWHADGRTASIAILRGDHDLAVKHMNRAWDLGYRSYWRSFMVYDPLSLHLKDHPGYQDLIARFEADMARQREEAYELLGISK
jgi:TolB-like protein